MYIYIPHRAQIKALSQKEWERAVDFMGMWGCEFMSSMLHVRMFCVCVWLLVAIGSAKLIYMYSIYCFVFALSLYLFHDSSV